MVKRYKAGTKTFKEETYVEQSRSLNIVIVNLEKTIKANIKRALSEEKKDPKEKHIKNLENLIERLKKFNP